MEIHGGAVSESPLSFTPDAAGEYQIMAYIYRWDLSVYTEVYTLTVSESSGGG